MQKNLHMSKKNSTFAAAFEGKLSEWSKEPHSKCGVRITSYRGFESLTFRLKSLGASYGTLLILFREGQGLLSPRSVGSYLASLERLLLRNFRIPHFPTEKNAIIEVAIVVKVQF